MIGIKKIINCEKVDQKTIKINKKNPDFEKVTKEISEKNKTAVNNKNESTTKKIFEEVVISNLKEA